MSTAAAAARREGGLATTLSLELPVPHLEMKTREGMHYHISEIILTFPLTAERGRSQLMLRCSRASLSEGPGT